jgi:acetylornithine deacetylase
MVVVDRAFVERTLRDLVRINSVNPSLDPEAPGEREIAAYVADTLSGQGLKVDVHECAPGRPNVVGQLGGCKPGPTLMFNAHLDTVDVKGMEDPFSGEVRDGRLFGRGAYDMKGGLAAGMAAVKALADAGCPHAGDVLVAGVADEEYASLGTQCLLGRYRVDAAIVTEPTALDVCLAHKGFMWAEVVTYGRAAHGSRFDLGIDANMHMGRVLAELDELERDLRMRAPHPLVGPPSLHAATISGGTGLSTYAASCRLQIERRTVPGERTAQITGELEDILHRQAARDAAFDAELRVLLVREPFETSPDAPIVRALVPASTSVLGSRPAFVGQTPWMDAALLAAAGIDTVVFGAAGAGAHAKEEWVDVESVTRLAQCLVETVLEYGLEREG